MVSSEETRVTEKRIPRPRDPLALAKLIGDIATGKVIVLRSRYVHYREVP
jgi:hypothetical protein